MSVQSTVFCDRCNNPFTYLGTPGSYGRGFPPPTLCPACGKKLPEVKESERIQRMVKAELRRIRQEKAG